MNGPPSIGLQGPHPASARGHLPSRTLPYGRERYKFRWPLVMCLEEVAAVLRARLCKMAVAAGCYSEAVSGRAGRAPRLGAAGSLVLRLGGRTRVEARSHLDWVAPAGLFILRCRDLHLPLKFQTRRTRWLLLGQSTTMEP